MADTMPTMIYEDFLKSKARQDPSTGILDGEISLNPNLFDFQADIVRWACRRGRAAIFAGTGLGKSLMELSWANAVASHTGYKPIIVTPLAVAAQMVREGEKFGIKAKHCRSMDDVEDGVISVTNYQRLHLFDADEFGAAVLDESSILKSTDGKTRTMLINLFRHAPFRLAATATPAPNDYMELGNHAEFLGVMTQSEMLSTFFVHDGGETQKWRLKGHARADFWKWVCSWAVMLTNPSQLGYDGSRYELPPLNMVDRVVETEHSYDSGNLFAIDAVGLQDRIRARKNTVNIRASEACRLIDSSKDEQWIVWCNLNTESDAVSRAIDGAVEVCGSDSDEHKEQSAIDFSDGKIRVLVSKPSIFGFGMNFQRCHNMVFVGLNDSWEQVYQAIRRCWRFGQEKPVNVYFVSADIEGKVVENLKRKESQAVAMLEEMVTHAANLCASNIKSSSRTMDPYCPEKEMVIPSWL